MRYDKNGFPVKEYYIEELKKPIIDKIKAEKNQKYYTGGTIILMFVVLIGMYLVLYQIFNVSMENEYMVVVMR